jgi:hypothetical protein
LFQRIPFFGSSKGINKAMTEFFFALKLPSNFKKTLGIKCKYIFTQPFLY